MSSITHILPAIVFLLCFFFVFSFLFVFAVAAVSFVLTLLLVSVYKLLLNYFHQLLFRPHLLPEHTTVPGPVLPISLPLPSPFFFYVGLLTRFALPQKTNFAGRRQQQLQQQRLFTCIVFASVCLQCLSPAIPIPPFPTPLHARLNPHMKLVRVQFHCSSGAKVDLLLGRIFTTFVSVSVWFFISFDFPSPSFHVCVIVYLPHLPNHTPPGTY